MFSMVTWSQQRFLLTLFPASKIQQNPCGQSNPKRPTQFKFRMIKKFNITPDLLKEASKLTKPVTSIVECPNGSREPQELRINQKTIAKWRLSKWFKANNGSKEPRIKRKGKVRGHQSQRNLPNGGVKHLELAGVGDHKGASGSWGNFSVFLLRVSWLQVTDTQNVSPLLAGSPKAFLALLASETGSWKP